MSTIVRAAPSAAVTQTLGTLSILDARVTALEQLLVGRTVAVPLLGFGLANGATFTSEPVDTSQPLLGTLATSAVFTASSDGTFTAKMQAAADGITWSDQVTYTITTAGGLSSTSGTNAPAARYIRFVITATAAQTGMNAKVVLS